MPFFSNLLPEGYMRTYLAEGVGVNSEREFFVIGAWDGPSWRDHDQVSR